jgi:hypothetical protein
MPSDARKPPPRELPPQHLPGDRATLPAALELDSTTAWAEFERLQDDEAKGALAPQRSAQPDFAPTVPDTRNLQHLPADEAPLRPRVPGPLTVQDVMVEARRFNRVCPQPEAWQRLYDLLPAGGAGRNAPAPIGGPAWRVTPAMSKRMCLRDQIEWAHEHGTLEAVMQLLKSLPETQWHHMDD